MIDSEADIPPEIAGLSFSRQGAGESAQLIGNIHPKSRHLLRGCVRIIFAVLIYAILAFAAITFAIWLYIVFISNSIARHEFSAGPCWFVVEDRPINMPELVPGTRGIYIPNPLRQFDRRYSKIFVHDANVSAPHFAIAALDREGRAALWGWSYRQRDFWPISKDAWSRGGYLADFASEDAILAACPDLKAPIDREDQ